MIRIWVKKADRRLFLINWMKRKGRSKDCTKVVEIGDWVLAPSMDAIPSDVGIVCSDCKHSAKNLKK